MALTFTLGASTLYLVVWYSMVLGGYDVAILDTFFPSFYATLCSTFDLVILYKTDVQVTFSCLWYCAGM